MKKTMTYVVAAAAVAMALVSCSKDKLIEKGTRNEQTSGVRTLTVYFAQGTKTYVTDGSKQPLWAENDQILLADGTATETYTVTDAQAGHPSFQITTALTGTIKAVYPASAAVTENNTITGVKVPATQNGTFGSANICIAEESEGNLSFQNQTAVVEVKILPHRTSFTVTSLGKIDSSTGQRGTTVSPINTTGADAAAKSVINVTGITDSDNPQICYVAVQPGVLLADLNIDTGSEMGGFSPNFIKGKTINDQPVDPATYAVEKNYIYTLPDGSLHEYVELTLPKMIYTMGMYRQDGNKTITIKWATMNIGATSITDNGEYFMWGEVVGHKPNGNTFTFQETNPESERYTGGWSADSGFALCNSPFLGLSTSSTSTKAPIPPDPDGPNYNKYKTTYGTLELKDDAANSNWGGSWRMPSGYELSAFIYGISSYSKRDDCCFLHNAITFSAAGYGEDKELKEAGNYGCYWASSNKLDANIVEYLFFNNNNVSVKVSEFKRYYGASVRAISD